MHTLAQREAMLVDVLKAALPSYGVRGALPGTPDSEGRDPIFRPPEVQVLATEWLAPEDEIGQGGGAQRWTIRIVNNDAHGAAARRIGDGVAGVVAPGLHPAAECVREALAGLRLAGDASPLLPLGGAFVNTRPSCAVWDEHFAEYLPLPGHARPALASGIEQVGVLAESADAGASELTGTQALDVSDLIVVGSGGITEFLGAVQSINGTRFTPERASSHELPAGATLWRLTNALRFPATPTPGTADQVLAGVRVDFDLAGGRHATRLSSSRRRITRRFAPVQRVETEEALRSPLLNGEAHPLLYAEHDGRVCVVHPDGEPEETELGFDLVALELAFLATDAQSMQTYEEPEA
ncbi:MAG: hypothetical protein PWP23_2049 [Candidatus Sumerlaeota bacterium]|nr:hypothetical protein [Candidatus Sumerlaeota bacterium]